MSEKVWLGRGGEERWKEEERRVVRNGQCDVSEYQRMMTGWETVWLVVSRDGRVQASHESYRVNISDS